MNNFWQRTITGTLFVAALVGCLGFGFSFWLFLAVCVLGLWEFYTHSLKGEKFLRWYGVIGGAVVFYLFQYEVNKTLLMPSWALADKGVNMAAGEGMAGGVNWIIAYFSFALLFLLFLIPLLYELFRKEHNPIQNIGGLLLGWAYVGLPCALAVRVDAFTEHSHTHFSFSRLLVVFILIWANDTFAYLVGRLIGKTSFSKISPKKTIEGTAGGFVFCLLTGYLISCFSKFDYAPSMILMAGIVSITATVGDLIESMFKRHWGIKDSGNILPGHGGILDRFDSFIFTVPFIYIFFR